MRRPALYSNSNRAEPDISVAATGATPSAQSGSKLARFTKHFSFSNIALLWSVVGLLALLLAISFSMALRPGARTLTQEDINAAVLKTLETTVLPSAEAKAYEAILPSVVRVVSIGKDKDGKDGEREIGRAHV